MGRQIFVNRSVEDLPRSAAFFTALGFTFEEQSTDEHGTAMIVDDGISVMLLTREFFATFTDRPVVDAEQATEAIVAFSAGSREEVDETVTRALAVGGTLVREPEDHDFMYGHGFRDLDGHIWELVFMDPDWEPKED